MLSKLRSNVRVSSNPNTEDEFGHIQSVELGEWYMIVCLEKRIPAQLDEQMRERLLQEKFDAWLQEQVQQLSDRDKAWLGFVSADFTNFSPMGSS
ncbi:MAG: hypothetical protein EDM05_59890 [Leptolyngbya sp. IPPAS B-1204]|jgi:hypothetical protein|nr:hypothetical protein [Elainella sp. C42_A2020_010]RNJ67008.1 MAG: hypothetical protein EDM05_22825 [Leptolyngbya sp. IPPAS B-1204]